MKFNIGDRVCLKNIRGSDFGVANGMFGIVEKNNVSEPFPYLIKLDESVLCGKYGFKNKLACRSKELELASPSKELI